MSILQLKGEVTVHQVSTGSVGDHSYLIVVGDSAAVIDPQRDIDRVTSLLGSASPRAVLETHVHNDYVSGGTLLTSGYGCRYLLPSGSGASVQHDEVGDGDRVDIAEGWHLRALRTPGHTPHHTSYALVSDDGELVVFTGGSMLVGAVGRTDLIDPSLTDGLTRDQYRSVRRLAEILGDSVVVAPTHGAGSFCAAGPIGGPTSTIGEERTRNPALVIDDIDEFVTRQRAGHGLYPAHYAYMAAINQTGATPLPPSPPVRNAAYIAAFSGRMVDLRSASSFAAGHIPGSISIPYSSEAATYLGWVVPWRTPVILISDSATRCAAMVLDLARIGYDTVDGVVIDSLEEWKATRHAVEQSRLGSFAELANVPDAHLLDVRDPVESAFVIPGATRLHVSEIPTADIDGPVWVHCSAGYRSVIAASILNARGIDAVAITDRLSAYAGSVGTNMSGTSIRVGRITVPPEELQWRFDTSGGPGGQHANKAATRVELSWDLGASGAVPEDLRRRMLDRLGSRAANGVVTVMAGDTRSQWRNRAIARHRMEEALTEAMQIDPHRISTGVPSTARRKRLERKKRRAEIKRGRQRPEEDED